MQQAGDGEAAQQRPTLTVSVLDPNNKDDIAKAIDCASACFCGTTTMDGRFISEPLNQCSNVTYDVQAAFFHEIVPCLAADGLCTIARDSAGNVLAASFAELYKPRQSMPQFPPHLAVLSDIYRFLSAVQRQFVCAVEAQTGQRMEANQWAYWGILGIRGRVPGVNIADAIVIRTIELAKKRKLKGIFGEFTNPKSERVGLRNGFVPILNAEGKPVEVCYAEDPVFKAIDPKVATHCKMLVNWLENPTSTSSL